MPTETSATQDPKRFRCRHIFADGHRCGSPALRQEHFCYFHHTARPPASTPRRQPDEPFTLPLPEDRTSIQLAIGQIVLRLADGSLELKRARLLLYALQIASQNLPRLKPVSSTFDTVPFVEDPIPDPEHGALAPIDPLPANPDDDQTEARIISRRKLERFNRECNHETAAKTRANRAVDQYPGPDLTYAESRF